MTQRRISSHTLAVLEALLVTFLWSTSWVLMKIGLEDIPALTFAGLRYSLAFAFLALYVWRRGLLPDMRNLSKSSWRSLITLGIIFYAVTQGAIFLSLTYLPAITLNLILSFTTVFVALSGILFLKERPEGRQWLGIFISLIGAFIFFYPAALNGSRPIGALVALVGLSANTLSSILGRHVNYNLKIDPTIVTLVSMGVGGFTLLIAGGLVQGLPSLSGANWAIVFWLAIVNSAFAFTLWNRTLQTLSAMESSVINNTMMIQIPLLAWLFLDERPTVQQILGMILAAVGVFMVQVRRKPAIS